MILSQAACLALGLWLQDCFLRSLGNGQPSGTEMVTSVQDDGADGGNHPSREHVDEPDSPGARESTLAMQALAFCWIAGLQALVGYLVLTRLQADNSRQIDQSTQNSLRRQKELVRTRDAVIFGLAKLAESRDPETGHHLERIALYSRRLATALQRHPTCRDRVTSSFVRLIGISSALHDIGKVGVKDSILLKPGALDEPEWAFMQQHPVIGGKCIEEIERRLGNSNFLQMARAIALGHHERWDGTGYPNGVAGERIPLAARIVAIVDVYDALSTRRVYKDAKPHTECIAIIEDGAGQHFDPTLVDVFLRIESDFLRIAQTCRDPDGAATNGRKRTAKELETLAPAAFSEQETRRLMALAAGCA